jgi:hypothetical protein
MALVWLAGDAEPLTDVDLETRWMALLEGQQVDPGEQAIQDWIFLFRPSGEYAMSQDSSGADVMRHAAWRANAPDSHSRDAADRRIKAASAVATEWFEQHPEAVRGRLVGIVPDLDASDRPAYEPQRPPFDPDEVFKYLVCPPKLSDWAHDPRRSDRVYIHQVLRTIRGVVRSGLREQCWMRKLERLLLHPEPIVQLAACEAFAQIEDAHKPIDKLLALSERDDVSPKVRAAALVVATRSTHPRVTLLMWDRAGLTDRFGWSLIVKRIGETGDDYALSQLMQLDSDVLPAKDALLLDTARDQIRFRTQQLNADRLAHACPGMVELAAWSDVHGHATSPMLMEWTISALAEASDQPAVRAALQSTLQGRHTSSMNPAEPGFAAVSERARAVVRLILTQ